MKYRLPEGCAGISHDGSQLDVADDGTLDLDEAAALALAPHGLIAVRDREPRHDAETGRRDDRPGSSRR